MGSVIGDGTKKIESKKRKTVLFRELQAVEAGFMGGRKNREVCLLPISF